MHRCYVPEVVGERVVLSDEETHHLLHVLRLGTGATVAVFDGRGGEWTGEVVAADRSGVTVAHLRPRTPVAEPRVAITLAVGLLKADQMSAVVRDATVLGATAIVPIVSDHTARRAGRSAASARWRRVAIAAARQCARSVVPEVHSIDTWSSVLQWPADLRLMCVEPDRSPGAEVPQAMPGSRVLLLVGPEGGWSTEEVAAARQAGVHLFGLGPRTLRAETAPTVALAALWTRWGWT